MTFRSRILIACIAAATAPIVVFALGARYEVGKRLSADVRSQVAASSATIKDHLSRQAATIDQTLNALAQQIDQQPQMRAALLDRADRGALLDYASGVMPQVRLDYLVLLDSSGTILSSGSFRNDFDRRMTALPALLSATGPVLLLSRKPEGNFLALTRARAFTIGDRPFALAGGVKADSGFMRSLLPVSANGVVVTLAWPGDSLQSDTTQVNANDAWSDSVALPFIDDVSAAPQTAQARFTISHSKAPLRDVQRSMDRWFIGALGGALVLAFGVARIVSARVNRPLEELAGKTTQVNFEQLDVEFATERNDEIGSLARLLDAMVQRLRASVTQLRSAERRATIGDLARQVNHDVRNGLLPIRNVIGHLSEVAHESPNELASVFVEREATLQGGIGYLENLAGNYARLSPRIERKPIDLNLLVKNVVRDADVKDGVRVQIELSDALPRVVADPVALRRIIENLTINAIESLEKRGGTVTVKTFVTTVGQERRVALTVTDTGKGIEQAALDRIFDDFYTTKERGSGLGLSIVRRLTADMGGRIGVQSQPGRGTTITIGLPVQP